ncbi:MAG: hypothetical protein H0W11_09145 [Gemmatimonadetes bacterium]|nr:hypothetical protein [Gemmatimonadota bacterium]
MMERGRDFLRAQVSNSVMQHRTLLENLEDHERQADDPRYRELCSRYIPRMREHQRMLDEYRTSLGDESGGGVKEAVGALLGKARDAVDAMRENDFLRVVGDVVTIRQAQDTFATFAAVGDQLGEPRLAEIGRMGETEHDEMQRDFNRLAQQLFVELARG